MAEPTTTKKQRLGIWIIAILMVVGTVGSLMVALLATNNAEKDKARLEVMMEEFNQENIAHNKKLSKKYFPIFSPYRDNVEPYEPEVEKLEVEELVEGKGQPFDGYDDENPAYVYYIGWLADGTVFDSSFEGDFKTSTQLKNPYLIGYDSIKGFKEGVEGMKVGGIRQLTMPASLGYGDQENGNIPANSTLRFIVYLIDNSDAPEPSKELIKLYERTQGDF